MVAGETGRRAWGLFRGPSFSEVFRMLNVEVEVTLWLIPGILSVKLKRPNASSPHRVRKRVLK